MAARSTDDESEHSADEVRPELPGDSDDSAAEGNEAWADVLGKLLHAKAPRTKAPILFKAKKDGQVRQKPATVLEIVDEAGTVKEQETQKPPDEPEFLSKRELRERKEKKRQWEEMSRIKPTYDEVEKQLARIATKGVVQLFNAVKTHQKQVDEKLQAAGQSETKRDKVMKSLSKGAFLDMLKEKKEEPADKPESWGVLRDDFMLGAEMKDWDKEEEGEAS